MTESSFCESRNMALIYSSAPVSASEWRSVLPPEAVLLSSSRNSESGNSLTRTNSSNSATSRSERRRSKSLRNIFGKPHKNKDYSPPIPEIGAADDRLPFHDGRRHRVELTPTDML